MERRQIRKLLIKDTNYTIQNSENTNVRSNESQVSEIEEKCSHNDLKAVHKGDNYSKPTIKNSGNKQNYDKDKLTLSRINVSNIAKNNYNDTGNGNSLQDRTIDSWKEGTSLSRKIKVKCQSVEIGCDKKILKSNRPKGNSKSSKVNKLRNDKSVLKATPTRKNMVSNKNCIGQVSQTSDNSKIYKKRNTTDSKIQNNDLRRTKYKIRNFSSEKPVKKSKSLDLKQPTKYVQENFQVMQSIDSDDSEWEVVDELSDMINAPSTSKNECKDNVKIEIMENNLLWGKKKKKTRDEMIQDFLRKEINQSIREGYENMHKVHLLCLFAHGIYVNKVLTSDKLLSSALSLVPTNYYTPKRLNLDHLEKFLLWFTKRITLHKDMENKDHQLVPDLLNSLMDSIYNKKAIRNYELVLLFVLITRSIGLDTRLVLSFHPLSWKPSAETLIKKNKEEDLFNELSNTVKESTTKSPIDNSCETECMYSRNTKKVKEKQYSCKILSSDSKTEEYVKASKSKRNLKKKTRSQEHDLDFELEGMKFRKGSKTTKKSNKLVNDKKELPKESIRAWAEVYVEEEEEWISVDVEHKKIHCSSDIVKNNSNYAYIVAYNSNQTIKDVTRRYVSSWLSYKDKIQCDCDWWNRSLESFVGVKTQRDIKEEKSLEENLLKQPMPKTIAEYKNHPLYALQRHLLKYEAIYPPNVGPIGFIRGEGVYPRDCVYTLQGRDNWFHEAKTVKVEEKPYKQVKARPKWDRVSCSMKDGGTLDLFGEWQVEDYDPPTARNGKVPRNEYGNVDLFKPCMIPKKCVHLRFPGLLRVARKLSIDCVPATVGFDFSARGVHPIHDGFIVCQEFKDILIDAYTEELKIQQKREEEKRLKRIIGSWKRLVKGVLLKERMKEKYGRLEPVVETSEQKKKELKEKEQKRKFKIKANEVVPPMLITHKVVNLKIDLDLSLAERNKIAKRKSLLKHRPKVARTEEEKGGPSRRREHLSSSENDEDKLTAEEKNENIRKILSWSRDSAFVGSNLALSDDDDLEQETETVRNKTSVIGPIKRSTTSKAKQLSKKMKKAMEADISDDEDFSLNVKTAKNICARRRLGSRLSLRKTAKQMISYEEEVKSEPDISFSESDDGDETYDPSKETKKPLSVLDLSEESE